MSLVRTTDVQCDGRGCQQWTHGTIGRGEAGKRALRAAAFAGWHRVKRDGRTVDLCPRCWSVRSSATDYLPAQ